MWRAQYQLLGGNNRNVGIAILYILSGGLVYYVFRRLMLSTNTIAFAGGAMTVLVVMQSGILVLGGLHALYKAQLRDFDTRMFESHRLTPMSGMTVALGYLFGATLQVLLLFCINLLFGCFVTWQAQANIGSWVVGNLGILNGTLTLWSMAVFLGMRPAKPINPTGLLIGAFFLGSALMVIVPSLSVFTGMLAGSSSAMFALGKVTAPELIFLAVGNVCSATLTLTWLYFAAVKYRRPDLPAINGLRGLFLLLLWVIAGGAVVWIVSLDRAQFRWTGSRIEVAELSTFWIGAVLSSIALAILPLCGSVQTNLHRRAGYPVRGMSDRMGSVYLLLAAAAMISALMVYSGRYLAVAEFNVVQQEVETVSRQVIERHQTRLMNITVVTPVAVVLALATARAMFLLGMQWFRSRARWAIFALFVFWAVIPLADGSRAEYFDRPLTSLFGMSPAGSIIAAVIRTRHIAPPIALGLIVQGVIAVVLTIVAELVTRKGPNLSSRER